MERKDVDVMIGRLNRMQIGYSVLVAHGLERNIDENAILDDIEIMVEKCLDVEDVRGISQIILNRVKEQNNY